MDLEKVNWTKIEYEHFVEYLFGMSDDKYKKFNKKLIPNAGNVIGIRMPFLRKIAKQISKGDWEQYLKISQSNYFEEIMLKGILIGLVSVDYNEFIGLVDGFIDKVNNWAICDCFCNGLSLVKKYKKEFFNYIEKYLTSNNPWHIRVGLVIMLSYYIDIEYVDDVLARCDVINSDEYYVKMAQAWLVSTSYAKFPEISHKYLENSKLDSWTFKKSIQKALESFRVSDENKDILRSMKKLQNK